MHWLRFFRVVNLPTVPGDVMAGAAAVVAAGGSRLCADGWANLALVAAASCALYLFGLADNDIVGAATDRGRPIPDGEISPRAARVARGMCLAAAVALVAAGGARGASAQALAVALAVAVVAYNRTKLPYLMGLCRGLNVLLGAAAACPPGPLRTALPHPTAAVVAPLAVALVWTAYIAGVTKYSEGEELDPARRRRVGALIGGIVYLQLAALVVCSLVDPANNPLLVAGAALLAALRAAKVALPKVGAS